LRSHIEEIPERLDGRPLLAIAEQRRHRHAEELADEVEQRGFERGHRVDRGAKVERHARDVGDHEQVDDDRGQGVGVYEHQRAILGPGRPQPADAPARLTERFDVKECRPIVRKDRPASTQSAPAIQNAKR